MTKDYMTLVNMGVCDKEKALLAYCSSSSVFYPPHPQFVVESTVKGFKKYWEGKIDLEKLKDYCYLRSVDGLYRYYGQFLNESDTQ